MAIALFIGIMGALIISWELETLKKQQIRNKVFNKRAK